MQVFYQACLLSFPRSLPLPVPCSPTRPPFPLRPPLLNLFLEERKARAPNLHAAPGKDQGACGQRRIPTCCGGHRASERGSGGGGGRAGPGDPPGSGRGAPSERRAVATSPRLLHRRRRRQFRRRQDGGRGDTKNGVHWRPRSRSGCPRPQCWGRALGRALCLEHLPAPQPRA